MKNRIGWQGMWRSFARQENHVELTQPLWILFALAAIVLVAGEEFDPLKLLAKVSSSIFSIFPSLAGLSLAGYTIIVGGIQPRILRRMARRHDEENANSLLEELNVTFAIALVAAIFTLTIAFIVKFLLSIPLSAPCEKIATAVNVITLVILVYASLVTLRSLLAIVYNVFNFGQVLDHFANREISDQEKPKNYRIRITLKK